MQCMLICQSPVLPGVLWSLGALALALPGRTVLARASSHL